MQHTPKRPLARPAVVAILAAILSAASIPRAAAQQAAQGTLGAPAAHTGGGHTAAPSIQAVPRSGEVHVDGQLDDAAWAAAAPASLAAQLDPDEGQPPSERTEVRVVVGEGALYIGARMFDREPGRIVSRLGRRDERTASDRLTIRLDARHDHLTAFLFDVFPAGNKGDASVGANGQEDYSWDPVWDVATSVDSLGWTAEMRIPFSQLRYDRSIEEWGIQIVRFIQRRQEEDVFSFVPKTESQGANRYGHLAGMRDLPATRRVEVTPYTSARARYDQTGPGNPFRDGSDYVASAGADLRVGLTSNLTLDATINPDFGQVEVDPAVVNLSAFEVTFDEKRPFFVEGADLFRFGQIRTFNSFGSPTTFFSRRIGRPPQGFVNDPAAVFTDVPEATTIAAAAKVTGKTRGGWSIALLDAVTTEEVARFAPDASSTFGRAPVEPLTNYFAGRVQRELRQGNTVVGALVTAVNRSTDDPLLTDLLRSSAYLGGVDLNHSWGNRMWALDASFAASLLNGSEGAIARAQRTSARYYQRPDAENIGFDPTRTSLSGYAGQIALTKTNGNWAGNLAYQEKSPGYETNDIGFTGTVGRRGISTDIHYYEPKPGPIFRSWTLGLLSGNDWNYDGDHTTSYVGSILNLTLRNFWRVNSNLFYNFASYDDQLTRGGPIARLPHRGDFNVSVNSDDRGIFAVGAQGNVNWNGADGYGRTIRVIAEAQPAPNIRFSLEPSFSRFHNVSQFVQGVTDPEATATFGRRAVFATVDQRELAFDTRLAWTFSPKVSLQLYVQPLISSGDFTDYKEFRTPGTFDFDVYGRDRGSLVREGDGSLTVDPDAAGPAASFAIPEQNFNFRSLLANVVFRWEYRPGSTLFVVWQQSRSGIANVGNFDFNRDFDAVFSNPATNVLAVKMTYWMGL